jgi:hypothetical protein
MTLVIILTILAVILYVAGGITFYAHKRKRRYGSGSTGWKARWDVDEAIIGAFLWPKYAARALRSGVQKVRTRDQEPTKEE